MNPTSGPGGRCFPEVVLVWDVGTVAIVYVDTMDLLLAYAGSNYEWISGIPIVGSWVFS